MNAELEELCAVLATGTSRQKRRCWQRLLHDGELWRGCEQVLREPGGAECLARVYDHLLSPWDRDPIIHYTGSDLHHVDEQVSAGGRIVSAAMVAALAVGSGPAAEMLRWARRAAGERYPVPSPAPLAPWPGALGNEDKIRLTFRSLSESCERDLAYIAAAQDAALSLLWNDPRQGAERRLHRLRVPVLLKGLADGHVIWLWLERLAGGFGQFFQASDTLFHPIQPDLCLALDSVWRSVASREGLSRDQDVRWWLGNLPRKLDGHGVLTPQPVEGRSIQGAAGVGLVLLLRDAQPDPNSVVSATLRPDLTLGPVNGIQGSATKLNAALELRTGAEQVTLIVSQADRLSATERLDWETRGLRVEAVHHLDEAVARVHKGGLGSADRHGRSTARAATAQSRGVTLICPLHPEAERLAATLERALRRVGTDVTRIERPAVDVQDVRIHERAIREAHLVVPLLTSDAGQRELLKYEVEFAVDCFRKYGYPQILPVWTCLPALGEDPLAAEMSRLPSLQWDGSSEKLISELEAALLDPARIPADPRSRDLFPPTGAVTLASPFYIPRETDALLAEALSRQDSIIRIKGARQMGKTSLLARGLQEAREQDVRVIFTDLQLLNDHQLASVDAFLQTLARWMIRQLDLSISLDKVWDPMQGASWNFREFICYEVLERIEGPLVWGIDEVDRLFGYPFGNEVFGTFRAWHNERATSPTLPWSRLTLAMAYATEAHLFITDLNQSPFNVGTRIALEDFTREQIAELNQRYGQPLTTRAEIERYWELLGGHPYLSHRGMHEMVSRSRSLVELAAAADAPDSPFADHLGRLLQLLVRDRELAEAIRAVLCGEPCPATDTYFRLWSAGVLSGRSPRHARLRCGLYESYLRKNLL